MPPRKALTNKPRDLEWITVSPQLQEVTNNVRKLVEAERVAEAQAKHKAEEQQKTAAFHTDFQAEARGHERQRRAACAQQAPQPRTNNKSADQNYVNGYLADIEKAAQEILSGNVAPKRSNTFGTNTQREIDAIMAGKTGKRHTAVTPAAGLNIDFPRVAKPVQGAAKKPISGGTLGGGKKNG